MRRALPLALLVSLAACAPEESEVEANEQDLKGAKPLGPEPEGEPARFPFILCHGFNAAPGAPGGFTGVADALRADGHEVFEAEVPPFEAVDVRAGFLAEEIDRVLATGVEKVNLVAHSMGGLDSRFVVSQMGYGAVVASVTTVSTPHGGSLVADRSLELLDGLGVDDQFLNDVAKYMGLKLSELAELSDVRATLVSLSVASSEKFNAETPNDPAVFYQSWAGVSSVGGFENELDFDACRDTILGEGKRPDVMSPLLVPLAAIVAEGELVPNDGLVAVESAIWGQFRGCIPGDHLDEVGVVGRKGRDRRTGFDHLRFYRNMAFELADEGF
jgi:triacylglycerol lipase